MDEAIPPITSVARDVSQEDQDHHADHHESRNELVLQRFDRPFDELGAVVSRDELHALGQRGTNLVELRTAESRLEAERQIRTAAWGRSISERSSSLCEDDRGEREGANDRRTRPQHCKLWKCGRRSNGCEGLALARPNEVALVAATRFGLRGHSHAIARMLLGAAGQGAARRGRLPGRRLVAQADVPRPSTRNDQGDRRKDEQERAGEVRESRHGSRKAVKVSEASGRVCSPLDTSPQGRLRAPDRRVGVPEATEPRDLSGLARHDHSSKLGAPIHLGRDAPRDLP